MRLRRSLGDRGANRAAQGASRGGPACRKSASDRPPARAGKLTARERLDALLDKGSFQEIDQFVRHQSSGFGIEDKRPLGDAVVTGHGTIDGRNVFVFAQDFTVFGGSLGEVVRREDPQGDGHGARRSARRSSGSTTRAAPASRRASSSSPATAASSTATCGRRGSIPQISVILGPCAGGAVYSPAMTDFIFMVRETSHMFITGPGRRQDGDR